MTPHEVIERELAAINHRLAPLERAVIKAMNAGEGPPMWPEWAFDAYERRRQLERMLLIEVDNERRVRP